MFLKFLATILEPTSPQYLVIGTVGVVQAAVYGKPRPDIHWTYAGRRIVTLTSDRRLLLGSTARSGMYDVESAGSLRILNVSASSTGRYSVYEENLDTGAKTEKFIDVEAGS